MASKRFAVTTVGALGSISCGVRHDAVTARGAAESALESDDRLGSGDALVGDGVPCGVFTVFRDNRGNVYVVDGRTIDELRAAMDAARQRP